MIFLPEEDLKNLKKIIPKDKLIIATSSYSGWKDILAILATAFANVLQNLLKPDYNNKKIYIAHCFVIFYKENELMVGEMDKKNWWRENKIRFSNTFNKLKNGQIRLFDLGNIDEKVFNEFLIYARKIKYSLIGAISDFVFFRFLRIFRTKKDLKNKRHCGEIFAKYEAFYSFFKTTEKDLKKEYNSFHPEALDYHLTKEIGVYKIINVKDSKLCLKK